MSQNSTIMPTTGTVSGLTLVNDINSALDTIVSLQSGASAPSPATTGMLWYNTTSKYLQQYDGASWCNLWYFDAVNHIAGMDIGGGAAGATIASATTTDLGSIPNAYKAITGTTTITGLGSSAKVNSIHVAVFGGVLTLTYNSSSLIIPGGISKTTANGDVMIAIHLGSGNWRVLDYIPIAGAAVTSIAGNTGAFTLGPGLTHATNVLEADPLYFKGYISGLILSTAGSSSTFGISAGCAVDDAQLGFMVLASAYTKTTSAWAVGSGNGGLDSSTIANSTWYHAYLIKRPDTGVVDIAFSLSASAPTTGGAIPSAYTMSRRIGSIKVDGSGHWIAFTQTGDKFIWSASVADVSNISAVASRVNKVLSTPTGVVTNALFRASCIASGNIAILFTSLQESDQTPVIGQFSDISTGVADLGGRFSCFTDTSSQIGVRSSTTNATYSIYTFGWEDPRGK